MLQIFLETCPFLPAVLLPLDCGVCKGGWSKQAPYGTLTIAGELQRNSQLPLRCPVAMGKKGIPFGLVELKGEPCRKKRKKGATGQQRPNPLCAYPPGESVSRASPRVKKLSKRSISGSQSVKCSLRSGDLFTASSVFRLGKNRATMSSVFSIPFKTHRGI